jgi:hypothetical protein
VAYEALRDGRFVPGQVLADKMMLLKVSMPNCLPADAYGERQRFAAAIKREMPAFIHHLVHVHKIHPDLVSGRTGIKSYFNTSLLSELEDISKEAILMSMIQMVMPKSVIDGDGDGSGEDVMGSYLARDLFAMIKANPVLKKDSDALFKTEDQLGKLLHRIAKGTGKYSGLDTDRE